MPKIEPEECYCGRSTPDQPIERGLAGPGLLANLIGRVFGGDDGAEVHTTCASLVASCHMNGVEPETHLRDLL